jgi:hypothetical protein
MEEIDDYLGCYTFPKVYVMSSQNLDIDVKILLSGIESQFDKALINSFLFKKKYQNFEKILQSRDFKEITKKTTTLPLYIYAESFIYSVNMMRALLEGLNQLNKDLDVKEKIREILNFYDLQFNSLKDIRDTIQHLEDRLLGKDKKGNKINTNVLSISNLVNSKYTTTGADGKHLEIEIVDEERTKLLHKLLTELFSTVKGKK